MQNLDKFDTLFVIWAFVFQICLIVLFAIRRSNLDLILQYGWVFYLLSIPAVIVSILILRGGKEWSFWFGGFIFLVWAVFGLIIEYGPYVLLYLGTTMFYWFPLGVISRPLWYIYAVLFGVSTYLNISSH